VAFWHLAEGVPIAVLVPGLGLGPAAWLPTVRALGRVGLDSDAFAFARLPGHGLSAHRADDLSPVQLARGLVDAWLPPAEVRVLMGHSSSCQVVVHAAALAPERIRGLVLVGPTTDPRANAWPSLVRRWLATARHEPPWQVPTLVRQYRTTGLVTMGRAMEAARRDRIDEALREVHCHVLVLRGVHDQIAPSDWVHRLVAPHADRPSGAAERTAITLPEGGHMVPLTNGPLVAQAVLGFFAEVGDPWSLDEP
jgi:pimeloyl-ACP methyl ester carboxylesterase